MHSRQLLPCTAVLVAIAGVHATPVPEAGAPQTATAPSPSTSTLAASSSLRPLSMPEPSSSDDDSASTRDSSNSAIFRTDEACINGFTIYCGPSSIRTSTRPRRGRSLRGMPIRRRSESISDLD